MELSAKETYEQREARRAIEAKDLQAEHPHLIPNGNGLSARIAATKNIRIELKRAFAATKFSIKSRTFSMGDSIDVEWTDGPTSKQVDEILNKYQAGDFDGMTDYYDYRDNAWTHAFGHAKYVSGRRSFSDDLVSRSIATLAKKYSCATPPTAEEYRSGNLYNVTPIINGENNRSCSWSTLILRECEQDSFLLG